MTATVALPTEELIALYAGDDLSDGHPTLELAVAICDRIEPHTAARRRVAVYGDMPPDTIGPDALSILNLGWQMWERSG